MTARPPLRLDAAGLPIDGYPVQAHGAGFAWGAEPDLVQPSLQSARFRIEAFSFTDDDAMTENCTRKLLEAMPHAPSRLHVIQPASIGLPAIGHVGAFRRQAAQALWPELERVMGGG